MRVSTNSIVRQYNSSINNTLSNMNDAYSRVLTGRRFSVGSQDPASASKAYQLRRDYLKNADYMSNVDDVKGKLDSVESAMTKISKSAEDVYAKLITVEGTASPEQRKIIASELREIQKSMIMDANVSYNGQFLFGGSSTKKLPFELTADGKVTYRGVDVDSKDPDDQKILEDLKNEKIFVDLGFGLEVTNGGDIVESSAYNTSYPGITFLGHGADAQGNPKNIISMLGKLANEIEKDPMNTQEFKELKDGFEGIRNNVLVNMTKLGSNYNFLTNTQKRLEDNEFNLNEKISKTEFIELPEAMLDYSWYQYSYNAALKVGSSILSPSFIDFMR